MERQLRKGNVAEALFRLWFEDRASALPRLACRQQGYNPVGVVDVGEKREKLKRASDPDFVVARDATPDTPLVGVSINAQRAGYTTASTMGGLCIRCSRAIPCLEGRESNLWYNRYNITNDYPQYRKRHGGIDVVLVTLMLPSLDSIYTKVTAAGWDGVMLDYIKGGAPSITGQSAGDALLRYLRFGARGTRPRKMQLMWVLHSELEAGTVPHFVTGGLSQFGRPREVCCVDVKLARDEASLLQYLRQL